MIYKNLNEAFVEELAALKTSGSLVNSRGSKQLERTFVNFTISDPSQLEIEVPARKFNKNYGIAEWLWYISANAKVNNISKLASIWGNIKDKYGEAESNYGSYIFSTPQNSNKTQWHWVVDELVSDPDSRRATIAINQPHHKDKNKLDYPCTHYIQFFIRDGKLDMGVYMRSNDAVFGFCNDVFTFALFQQLLLNELRDRGLTLELGTYNHSAGSFHIYERHFEMMDKILNNYYTRVSRNYPDLKTTVLKPGLTYRKLVSLGAGIPAKDIEKSEINDHVKKIEGAIFQ